MKMKRKSEASKNRGYYIAVCCCVSVIAAVGYVSRFAGGSKKEPQKVIPENKFTENVSEISQKASKEERVAEPVPEKETPVSKNAYAEDNSPILKMPVQGKVIGEFSGESLVFHKELSDWRSHNGLDIEAKAGDKVLASADGVVESMYADSMGNCVLIDHENGFKTLYANLGEPEKDLSGQNVRVGDEIGTVGDTAVADLTREAHLHFELLKDGNSINPTEYFK